jgi:hypothetical protein
MDLSGFERYTYWLVFLNFSNFPATSEKVKHFVKFYYRFPIYKAPQILSAATPTVKFRSDAPWLKACPQGRFQDKPAFSDVIHAIIFGLYTHKLTRLQVYLTRVKHFSAHSCKQKCTNLTLNCA